MKKLFLFFSILLSIVEAYSQQFISQKIYTTPQKESLFNKTITYKDDGSKKQTSQAEYNGVARYKITITTKDEDKNKIRETTKYVESITQTKSGKYLYDIDEDGNDEIIEEETTHYGDNEQTIKIEKIETTTKTDRFGIFGYGNLNQENEKKINGSTKFSCYYIPFVSKTEKFKTILNLSFNKNATNTDTLVASTLLFPELGNAAFIGTIEAQWRLGSKNNVSQFLSAFGEFSVKNIKAAVKDTNYVFDILSYTLGGRYAYNYEFKVKQGEETVSRNATFSLIPYLHFTNIPNEDNDDYRAIFGQKDMPSLLFSWGIKVVAQYHHFGIFADFRNMTRNAEINNRDIKGFNSNIGVVVSAELIQF